VGESVENPLLYYENNINALIYFCRNYNKTRSQFYFSSSCTVYGQAETMPITENASIQIAMSPYGNTKQMGRDYHRYGQSHQYQRYFVALFQSIGSHPSAEMRIATRSTTA
jgi:UDP-glucose 4-epimerase